MVRAFIKFVDGRTSSDPNPKSLAAALRDPTAVFWVDMEKPTDEEIGLLDDVFAFHPLAIEDSVQYLQRPKIESYNHVGDALQQGYFYMVIHGPDLGSVRDNIQTKELDLFVSERYLVTIHEESMGSIDHVRRRAEIDMGIVLDGGIDMLLYSILDRLVDNYGPILENLQEDIDALEEAAVEDPTPELLPRISLKKRELLNLRRIVAPQRDVISQLTRGEIPFIRQETRIYLRDVLDHLVRAVETIEIYRDLIVGTRDIYMSSVSNNLNQVMKTLTMITVIALPLTIITSFFGMNFQGIPGWDWMLSHPLGFWLSFAFVMALIGVLLMMFRRRQWL